MSWQDALGLILFFMINVVAETKPLKLPSSRSDSKAEITISGLSSYALLALFHPLHAALASAAAVATAQVFIEKKTPLKCVFNTCQSFITVAAASLAFHNITQLQLKSVIPPLVVGLACAITVYFIINTSLVSVGLALLANSSFFRTWASNFRWELIYIGGTIPLALLLIVAYQYLWIAGPLLFIAPLFLLREAYAQYVRLKTTYTETVRTLIKVIETHDTYTAGHSLRVAEYAKRIAVARKLSVKEVEKIEIAAYLHDLGKVDLAITHLVRKPGRLTAEEKRRVQLHPLVSADLAAQVTFFKGDIEDIIRHHHEHFNGTGYPHKLSGHAIPLGSRIILIADAFDAMTSNRMYRNALDLDNVRSEFIRFSGIQFDPELVPLLLEHCARDAAFVIPQVEIPYEEFLSAQITEPEAQSISA